MQSRASPGEGPRITEPCWGEYTDTMALLSCLLGLYNSVTASSFLLPQKQIFSFALTISQGENIKETALESLRFQCKENLELLLFFLNMCTSLHISHSCAKVLRNGKAGTANSEQSGLTTKNLLLGCAFHSAAVSASL